MVETAVGLFDHAGTAAAVLDALRASGVPSNGIRILSKPVTLPVDNSTSTPATDFLAGLSRDLRSMGATDAECNAYLDGARKGNILVFATGSQTQAEAAMAVMNAYDAIELEEYAGGVPVLPGMHVGGAGTRGTGSKQDRTKSEGARVFSW